MIQRFLDSLGRRGRAMAAREAFLDAFFWGAFAAASFLVADRIRLEVTSAQVSYSDPRAATIALGAALAFAGIVAGIRGGTWRAADADLARAADRRLGLADRLSTALELPAGELAPMAARDAAASLEGASPRRVLPTAPLGSRKWAAAALLAALMVAFIPLPDPETPFSWKIRPRRPATPGDDLVTKGGGGGGGGAGKGSPAAKSAGVPDDPKPEPDGDGGGRTPPPPLFGDPERKKLKERPEIVKPLTGEGDWKPSDGAASGGAATDDPTEPSTPEERIAAYKRQAEAWVGKDGFPEGDRAIVRGYFDRVAPAK